LAVSKAVGDGDCEILKIVGVDDTALLGIDVKLVALRLLDDDEKLGCKVGIHADGMGDLNKSLFATLLTQNPAVFKSCVILVLRPSWDNIQFSYLI
jgi:hypothetical protein